MTEPRSFTPYCSLWRRLMHEHDVLPLELATAAGFTNDNAVRDVLAARLAPRPSFVRLLVEAFVAVAEIDESVDVLCAAFRDAAGVAMLGDAPDTAERVDRKRRRARVGWAQLARAARRGDLDGVERFAAALRARRTAREAIVERPVVPAEVIGPQCSIVGTVRATRG